MSANTNGSINENIPEHIVLTIDNKNHHGIDALKSKENLLKNNDNLISTNGTPTTNTNTTTIPTTATTTTATATNHVSVGSNTSTRITMNNFKNTIINHNISSNIIGNSGGNIQNSKNKIGSLNSSVISESGRIKRKCVVESERRKLYLADLDSPPYYHQEEEPPIKTPRVKGRRGRPPKLGPDGFPLRRFPDMDRPELYYQTAPYDGYSYAFSTSLANLSCRLVAEGHFKNLIEHHKSITFPHNIFSQEIVSNHISHHKPFNNNSKNHHLNNRLNTASHMFSQPGPHMYRPGMAHISPHQPNQMYHNIMQQQQQQQQQQQFSSLHHQQQRQSNIGGMIGNYDYNTFYQINGGNTRRISTPNQIQSHNNSSSNTNHHHHHHSNLPIQQNTLYQTNIPSNHRSQQNNNIHFSIQNSVQQRHPPIINQAQQSSSSSSNISNNMNHMVQRLNPTNPPHIRSNINSNILDNNSVTSSKSNNNGTIWLSKEFRHIHNNSFQINNDKNSTNTHSSSNQSNTINTSSNISNSNHNQYKISVNSDHTKLMPDPHSNIVNISKLDNNESIINQSNPVTASTGYSPKNEL